jgi:pimeloyl-ACP methyl ester carboxylesterase
MNTYVLVHGSWHGAWCWEKVIPLLEQEGHTAVAINLPGHGGDSSPAADISLQTYADSICRALDAQPEPVILVGHSMGGIAISQAARYRAQKIKALIYLTGFLLRDGESLSDVVRQDKDSLIPPNVIVNESQGVLTLREDAVEEIFYGNCPAEDVARAKSLMCPDPLAPLATPLKISAESFGRIPRRYIECLRDRAISPAIQRQMYTATPCQKVLSMDTDHSPFFSAPEELARNLTAA